MSKYTPETLVDRLLNERAKGNIVTFDAEGFVVCPLSAFVEQSADGILYDLNRLEEVALTFLPKDASWVNNFAVALVIRELKRRIEALERVRRAADRAMCFLMDRKPNIWHLFDGRPYVPADERELMHLLFVLNGELALTHPAALAAGEESE